MNVDNPLMNEMTDSKCPFCSLGADVDIVCEMQTCVAFYDKYPVSPGHTLIIPKRHVSSYFDLSPQERQDMDTCSNTSSRYWTSSITPMATT